MTTRSLILAALIVAPTVQAEDKAVDAKDLPQPVLCYKLLATTFNNVTVGATIDLCGGTTDAVATVKCFMMASDASDDGGLGMPIGQAVDLCRPNGRRAQ